MGKTIAYIRTSTDKQDLNTQKLEILEWARKRDLKVDEFVEITMSSRKTSKQRRVDEMVQTLVDSDILIVTELSRLGRSTAEVIALINELVSRNIRVIILKQHLDIKELLRLGLSVRKIAGLLGYTNHFALNTYITKRKLREEH